MKIKLCKLCNTEKVVDRDNFYFSINKKYNKRYPSTNCIPCENKRSKKYHVGNPEKMKIRNRDWRNKARYDLDPEGYEELLNSQNHVCKICGKVNTSRALAVDHDHDTGRVRGLLCINCNRGLGNFKDSPELLLAAIEYLKEK